VVWEIALWQNKKSYFPSWINKVTYFVGPKCEHTQLIFPFKPNLFKFVQIFNNKIHSKFNIFHTLSIKSNSTITFQQHQAHLWIQVKFLFMILLMFIKKWFNNLLPLHCNSKTFQPKSMHSYSLLGFQRYQ